MCGSGKHIEGMCGGMGCETEGFSELGMEEIPDELSIMTPGKLERKRVIEGMEEKKNDLGATVSNLMG